MGCGTSRSPARVGVIVEDDGSLHQEFYPPLVDGYWMGQSAQDPSSSFCTSPSPPPYTPLPLSGHVTLMLGQGPSPAKRRNSIQSTRVDSYPGPPVEQEASQQGTEAGPRLYPRELVTQREEREWDQPPPQ
ncbi:hypothetical protein GBAR_LOCUS10550 [Geodia barretti]|uniref:Uncharacterized protein n=1 Tax=Geodia barretti TaxID=519541 RepID=A0AA35WDI2_GEOBA|nr:hypothetical protein GBAR_LOCUS10550 [Geodia barretti]